MMNNSSATETKGSSPTGRGGAGSYIEGELGAYYLLAMLAGGNARGLPDGPIERVRFQGEDQGFALDDLIVHVATRAGSAVLEIQSKRTISFSRRDSRFDDVCKQIANVRQVEAVDEERHLLAVATQRTSYRVSGPYQDVLAWARHADTATGFFDRLQAPGIASSEMREFVATCRANLVKHGVADDDEVVWQLLRRFQILEFDFESSAPVARAHALYVARSVLAPEDANRAHALWSSLIDISLEIAKIGGTIDRAELRGRLLDRGFRLAGDRDFTLSREKLDEMARFALGDVGTSVGGISLPRLSIIAAVDEARDCSRFVEVRGGPGAGKSAILRHVAERTARESRIIVLDPVRTPEGGWAALAIQLGVTGLACDFLTDLAASGGAVLFIDGIDMFTTPGKQRTVNDVLREVSAIDGFSVLVTVRSGFGRDGENWLTEDALASLGLSQHIDVPDLDDAEVAILSAHAPELRALLAQGHPAVKIARNPYRLSRLLKVPDSAVIRTEAALARHWWTTGDGVPAEHVRAAQRLLDALAEAALAGRDSIHVAEDSAARNYLLGALTLREVGRDHLAFYHDVLRDWAVAVHLNEDGKRIDKHDLSRPVPPDVARGIEFAGRLVLEQNETDADWETLLARLSPTGAHGSWRRHALLAMLRSELAPVLLTRHSTALLACGGRLITELTNAIVAVETMPMAERLEKLAAEQGVENPTISPTVRVASTDSARLLLGWCVRHADEIPIQAIPAIVKLAEIQTPLPLWAPELAAPVPAMLCNWLLQLDIRANVVTIPKGEDAESLDRSARGRLVADLRMLCMAYATWAPEQTKAYLSALVEEDDSQKVKTIFPMSHVLAAVGAEELARLVESTLIASSDGRPRQRGAFDDAFTYADSDYLPPSPAQGPFLALLRAAPETGLGLIRRLTEHAIMHHSGGRPPGDNGIILEYDEGRRFFPWQESYLWSRGQGNDYAVASGLMALEAWGHERLDAGEDVGAVLDDILGPEGSGAAFVMVAVDLLISHWPATRDALVPFMSSPGLLAVERQREAFDHMDNNFLLGDEPAGAVRLEHLRSRPSRGTPLERLIPGYLATDDTSLKVRERLTRAVVELGAYDDQDDFASPPFMGAYALNLLDPDNWVPEGEGRVYRSPPAEAAHLQGLMSRRAELIRTSDIEAKISLAVPNRDKGSAKVARQAVDYAAGNLPDDSDTDHLKSRSTRLIATAMLVARDGDDKLLNANESWVREVITRALEEKADRYGGSNERIEFNRPALAICALSHLWHRRRQQTDRDALVSAAARDDNAASLAFEITMPELFETDPRVMKAAVRVGFAAARYRWHPWDEDEAESAAYVETKAAEDARAIAAEIAWLDGGNEPAWPPFPDERPSVRRRSRIRVPTGSDREERLNEAVEEMEKPRPAATVHADPQAAAAWLKALARNAAVRFSWIEDLVLTYAEWSAKLNGYDLDSDAEIDNPPAQWNDEFYALMVPVMMTASDDEFERMLGLVVGLPDRPFGDVMETVLHAADVWYFNDASRPADRPVRLREIAATRTMALWRWRASNRPGDLSVDHETADIAAKLFMNTYNRFTETKSYLVPAVYDRIDPLLETLKPLLPGGPTAFIALCTMNMLMVAPRARHVDFLLTAAEMWLDRSASDATMWIELGIGRRIVEWLRTASIEEPALLTSDHPLRTRIDGLVGRLVVFGIPEAHELERQMQGSG